MFWKRLVLSGLALVAAISLSGCGASSKPVSVSVNASATTLDATNAVTLSATVANDKNSAGVNWTVTGGGTLSAMTSTSATYTAPASSSSVLTATVTATSVADATKTGTTTITVPAGPAITNSSLTAGAVGTAYSGALAGSGGIAPYSFNLSSGTLPAGLTMSTAGAITGTPTAAGAGTVQLTFQMTDSGKATPLTATAQLSLTINAAPAIAFPAATLAAGTYNSPYTASVAASGGAGALAYTMTSGALPTGLTLSPAGSITGTPTAVGTFSIGVKAADTFGDIGNQTFSLKVSYPVLAITPATMPTGYAGSNYTSTTLSATGGSGKGYTWAVASGSAMPAGLALSAAGAITGKPTAAGTTSVNITVTDSASNTATTSISVVVKPAVSITTGTTLPVGYVGSAYSQTLAAAGGSGSGFTWTVASGSPLPPGTTLSAAGLLSGTPTSAGSMTFTLTVTDSVGNTASTLFSVTINAAVSITSPTTLPGGYQGGVYTQTTLAATGGSGAPYAWTWAAASGSTLPAGLTLSTAGVITGTPTGFGTFNVMVTAKDSASNTATVRFSLAVEATLAISTPSPLKSGTMNVAYSQTFAASGGSGSGYTWTTTGVSTLATLNLSLSAAGVVSGTPSNTGTASFTAQVTDSQSHTASANFSVTVYAVLTVSTSTLPAASAGSAYTQALSAGGGTGSGYTWAATSSNLASYGLSLSTAGVVSGTPTSSGTASFTAQVTDSASNTAIAPLSITIYNALGLPTPNPVSIPSGTTGVGYSGSISATGGSGSYSLMVTGLPADGLSFSASGGTLNIIGTPASAQTVSFGVSVKDTVTNITVGPSTYTITVSNPTPVSLPPPNPSSLSSATINQSYTGSISASGGVSPYSWSINGSAVPPNGTPLSLTNGLSATNTGGNTLTISGTPTTIGTVTLTNVKATDSLSSNASNTYTIAVNAAGSQVSGQVHLLNSCGSVSMPPITVSINTSPVQTTTTDGSGNYSFASIPNGTNYTITPSITGASSVFFPPTQPGVVVNNSAVTGQDFGANLAYKVSGTVNYGGFQSGQVYVSLNNNNCGGGTLGTSITAPGSFTINGVPPGTYTLSAGMDIVGSGNPNASDPSGSLASVPVVGSDLTGQTISMTDPSTVTLAKGPGLSAISPTDLGVVINFKAISITNSSGNQVEQAESYTVQWSTSSTFSNASSFSFKAGGAGGTGVWFINNSLPGLAGTFSNGTTYFFRAQGVVASVGGPWTVYGGGTPKGVIVNAPTGVNTVSGSVTFTGSATGPLYVGFFDQNTGMAYATRIAAPSSPQPYTVQVPTGTGYYFFGILDQNNNGNVDPGDVSNTHDNGSASVDISGNLTGENLTLSAANSTAAVTTQHWSQTNSSTTSIGFNLNFDIRGAIKLPVAVQLVSGPNVISPVDIGQCAQCGSNQFQYFIGIGTAPVVGDSYAFKVTYSDGGPPETINAAVTAVLNAFATNLAPTTGTSTSTQPTFSWTDPASASSYVYSFYLSDNNGNQIWQIPGNNSKANGFTSSVNSLTWGVDPTDPTNTPNPTSLTVGAQYFWQIQVQDTNGNSAQTQVNYIP